MYFLFYNELSHWNSYALNAITLKKLYCENNFFSTIGDKPDFYFFKMLHEISGHFHSLEEKVGDEA
jgi:hypothetical protein